VFTRAFAPETCLPERLPGNVFKERLTRESVNQAVATGTWLTSLYTTSKRLYKGDSKTESARGSECTMVAMGVRKPARATPGIPASKVLKFSRKTFSCFWDNRNFKSISRTCLFKARIFTFIKPRPMTYKLLNAGYEYNQLNRSGASEARIHRGIETAFQK
jgi:hypothetical protein